MYDTETKVQTYQLTISNFQLPFLKSEIGITFVRLVAYGLRFMTFFRNFTFFWLVMLLFQTCTQQECEVQVQPLLKLKLVKLVRQGSRFIETADTIKFDAIYGIRSGKPDSTFYQDTTLTSSNNLLLTLSPSENQSEFVFKFQNGNTDVVSLQYQRRQVLISEICGFTVYFDSLADIKPKKTYKEIYKEIDSVKIETPTINQNGQVIHVKLYFF